MSRTILLPFATALCVCSLVTPAHAQRRALTDEQKATLQDRLKAADANGDGLIDRAEAAAKLPRIAKRFDTLDANSDGQALARRTAGGRPEDGERRGQ